MTRNDIRLTNLRILVGEYLTIAAVAEASGTSEKYLSQILNASPLPSGKPRQVGNNLARRLEEGCLKPVGWMDTDHRQSIALPGPSITPAEAELIRLYRCASTAKRRAMMAVARL